MIGCCVGALFATVMLVVGAVEARRRAKQRARGGPAQHRSGAAQLPGPRAREAAPGLSSMAEIVEMGSGGTQAVVHELVA